MASSYYAKKKEESDKKIAEALEARRNRTSASSQASADKASTDDSYAAKKEAYDKRLQDALDARSERIQSTLPEILSDIQDRYSREASAYNSTKKPAFGSFESTYDSQRESRINISKLRDKVEAYRGYMEDGVADQLLSSLDQMKSGYDSHLTYSRFASQKEYDTAKQRAGWQQKYQGKTYDDLQRTLSGMKDGDEKNWLSEFAPSVMTKDDYDKVIATESRELEPLKKLMEEAGKIQREAWSGNPADANRQNKNARLQALAKRYGYSSYEEAKTRYDELQKSQYEHTNASKYKFLDENQDYEVLSKQVAEDPTAGFGIGIGDKWWGKGDPKYDYINDIDGTRQSYYGRFASGGGSPYAIYDQMTDEEIASYNYLYNAEGEQAANDYLEYLEYTLNERMQGTAAANAKMLADEYPVFASAVSVPINLMSGIGAIGVAGQNIARGISGEYKPIDYNASTMAPGVISSTIRGTVSQNITNATGQIELDEEEHPVLSRILNGKSLGDVYQLGMSMADSAAIAAMAPAIGSVGTALLGGSAASQGILDAVAAGANDEQAIMMGVMNGAFEMLFEKVSLDNLLNGKSRNILTAMFKQGVIEGTEEFNTTLANTLADILVMAEKSSYKSSIAEYEAHGLSTEDATKRALLDVAIQMGWDFVGGMASGGLMGGASAPIQNYQYANEEGNRIYGEDADALIGEALEINPESKLANKLNDRLTDGKKVSGAQLYKLAEENEATMYSQDMTAIQKAAETRLSALGETGDVEAISAALAKQAAGKKLTKSERATLAGSRYAQRVANELNPANIDSGGYASGWTSEIGTNRINADEYNRIVEAANLPQDGGNVSEDKLDAKPQNVATTQNPQADEGVMDVSPVSASEDVTPVAAAEPVTQEEPLEETEAEEENPITLEDASKKYGAQAGAMVHTYVEGQDVAKYDAAYQAAYDMGMSGVSLSYAKESESTSYLSETQRELAYEAGVAAADSSAKAQAAKNQAKINGKTGRRSGTVQGKGVSIADLKQTFNDPQGKAYRYLTTVAEATGIDIVLYKSEANEDGVFEGAQGKFTWSEDKIYIDVNAGLVKAKDVNELSKYAMLRTFAHEFTHFIEKWNPVQYNELRKVVFDTLTERGENVHDLIERKRAQASNMTYDMASREVVAEAMTDILPDANFVQELAEKHKNLFQKLLEKLKEFVDNLRDYFNTLAKNPSREANALKEEVGESVKYLESIVRLFDNVAVEAVENYQLTVAVDEVTGETSIVEEKAESPAVDTPPVVEETAPVVDTPVETPPAEEAQEIPFDKRTLSLLKGAPRVGTFQFDGQHYVTSGSLVIPTTLEGVKYAIGNLNAITMDVGKLREALSGVTTPITRAPVEGKAGKLSVYEFSVDKLVRFGKKLRVDKKLFSFIDGGLLYYKEFGDGGMLKSVNEDGSIKGYLLSLSMKNQKGIPLTEQKPAKLKSFSKKMQEMIDAQANPEPKKPDAKVPAPADTTPEVPKAQGITKDQYDEISDALQNVNVFYKGGYEFRVSLVPGAGYNGMIKRQNDGYVSNARDVLFSSMFATRQEATADLAGVARTNRLLESAKDADAVKEAPVSAPSQEAAGKTASERLADKLLEGYINPGNLIAKDGKVLTAQELYALADEAFGGTQAEGAYNRKDAYDAMELAVNKFLLQYAAIQSRFTNLNGNTAQAESGVRRLEHLLELLPTQSVRTQEQQDYQQFSTPPNIAYLAAWAANINQSDFVLEPSAGIGGLAVFAKAWGAEVAVNELSKRRLEVLRAMGFDHLFNENAEQIDNILPDSIAPSVVIMNPPFSSTAGRTANNKTSNAEKHIDQALARLRDGGRLVAVLGKGMNDQDYYRYWDKLRKTYSIRANLSIDGNNYKKYGTTWGVQIVVIDKTGPQTGETITGRFTDLTEVPKVLEGIRNDRSHLEENRPASRNDGIGQSVPDGGNRQSDTGNAGSDQRTDGSASGNQREENRKSAQRNEGAGNRTDGKKASKTGSTQIERQDGASNRETGRTDTGDGDGTAQPSGVDRHQPEQPLPQLTEQDPVNDDGVYATFIAPEIPVKGGKKHPAVLVESAAMAAVSMPKATYQPKLPADVVRNNLSDAQLVTVTYAGQAHEQKLPDGRRKGFFVGDGTGVGKGRQIAGIILDNFMQGRTKAVWISKNNDLFGDAIRDWTATTGRSKEEVVSHSKIKPKDKISLQEGILYSTYDTIKSEKGGSRLDQIVEWLGKDFDGVIAFDEAHNMGNLFGKKGKFGKSKGSEKARAGVELQRRLPNARIVYVSATAATEVDNLAYAERIGLWGQGTAFSTAQDFISKIGASGLAAMELVIRDMKAMGTYVARSISYNGVNYDTVEHSLDPMQTEIYNTMSRAWQKTMQNVQSALETTGGQYNSTERQKALGNFYSAMQRFYNQVLTSMSMPSVIADMRKELADGHSCVLQIVNTNEAQQNKQLAEAKATGESLDNLDLTPREALVGYLSTSFPTQMFEEYTDDDGNLRSRPVMDSAGNPVQNKEAIRQRDALIAEVNQMSIPDGPLEMLFDAFGPDAVAENSGRSRRVVPRKQADGTISRVEERRTLNHRTADVQAFQDGKKRILVFSDAGGTGKSYHADRTEKNQQLRIHYVLQPGWVASNAVQGFGRTHRSNEASAPVYKLVTTNIKGQKRFTSTIARRLDQLGALTKGQRDTGSGMFGAKDNLETDLARDSLREFYRRLGRNQIEGIDGMRTLDRLGLKQKFTDEYGSFKLDENVARDIGTFLNRILALEVDEQNVVFDAFISIYEMELEAAIQAGTLDTGMENVKADKIEVVDDKVIRQDKNTGAATHYIQAKTYTKPKVVTTVAEMQQRRAGFEGIYRTESGAIKAVYRIADKTTEYGAIQKQYRLVGPNQGAKNSVWGEMTLQSKAEPIDKADWQKEWSAEVAKVPEYNEDTLHMLTGALLPIWNSLPQEGNTKVKRLIANDGGTYLGRVIDKDLIDNVLKGFSMARTMEVFTAQQVMDKALGKGTHFYLTNDKVQIFRSRVSGEWRLEISQPYNSWYLTRRYPGLIQERISYRDRYFIPVGEKGIPILEKLLSDNPVRNATDDAEQYQNRAYLGEDTVQEQSRGYLEEREPAPVFYSQMAKVVDGVKIGKLEASSVVNMLRGKGVKAEEIKWSGIETWLEGKKSVTKAELQEFIAGSMLKIEEQMSGTATFIADDGNTYKSEADFKDAAYAIADARGIDRIRVKFVIDTEYDMDAYAYVGAWNNTILTAEVSNVEGTSPRFSQYKLDGGTNYREILFTMPDNSYSNRAMRTHWGDDAEGVLAHARIQDFTADGGKMLFVEEIQSDYHNEGHQSGYADSKLDAEIARLQAEADKRFFALEDYSTEVTGLAGEWETVEKTVKGSRLLLEYLDAKDAYDKAMNDYVKRVPDAPFRDSYHEYVLKRLIRMAAEQGYDSIGWTTAKMQSDRWSEEYAEGYRIEYDQDIPKFLNKYGKKWGAKVGKTTLNGETVWTLPITDTMKESVLYEGQTQYQDRAYLAESIDEAYMDAVNSGDMATAQRMVNERAEELRAAVFAQTDVPTYRIRRRPAPKATIPVYKVFTMSETGKPSALFVSSQYDLPIGVWLDAQDTFHFTDQRNGHMYVPSTKNPNTKGGATGRPTNVADISDAEVAELEKRGYLKRDKNGKLPKTITSLAYRPGWHAGDLPFFPQGGMQIEGSNYPNVHRYNQVVFECEMIADHDYTDYHVTEDGRVQLHDMQHMPDDGSYKYSTNPMAQSTDIGAWYIGSSIRIVRALTQEECDRILQAKGRPVQEWQAYQDPAELQRAKAEARKRFTDKKDRDKAAKDAEYAYEHRYGVLDLDALGYDPTQTDGGKKLLDPVTYDDNGNVIPLSQRFNPHVQDVRYQERTNTLTDREVLAMAAEQVKVDTLTDAERDALAIFQKRLEKLTDLEEQRAEQGRLYKEQQFGAKPDRAAAAETLDRMHVLDAQIKRASADVLSVEEKTVLRNVLKKARKVVENQQWAHDQEILRRWRDRRANAEAVKKYRDRVRRDVDELTKWVLHPSNKDVVKHIPDALKESVIPFLSSINFMSKQSLKGGNATVADKAFQKQLKSLKAALRQNIDTYGLYSGYNDLPPNFMDRLQNFIDSVDAIVEKNSGEFVINQMTSDELRELSKVVRTLKDYIQQFNRFHVNAMYHHVYEAGDDTIRTLGLMKNASDKTGTLSNFVLWQQMRPAYAFERFGNGGKAIYDGLREGQAKLAFNTKTIVDFSQKAYTAKEVNAWEQEIKSINLGGDIVKMRVSQIMSLYELSKRKQALGHILKGGIRVATFKNGKHKISDVGHVITQEDLHTIISTLTPRQMEVADKLQKFMAEQGGTWGNYVSVKRFGEEMFGEKEYFPINSDGRHLQSNADEAPGAASLYALLNMSFTKELTENASNRIILYSIFDVFSNHMASMAQYNAFALPVLDALKWFNYQMKSDPDENGKRFVLGSVRDQMARVYGTPEETRPGSGKKGYAEIFVENILKAFNGTEAQGTSYDSIGMRSLHAYNRAQVAYNFRVVVQQPLAITRAAQIIDFRSIVQGTKLSPVAVKKNIEEMRKYSGIAAWKALGFYDVNISRGLNAIIKHSDTATDKLIEVGMKGAETADTLTWAGIWSACKAEVMRKQKLKPKDAGFYEAVTKLFEDVIYKTQVVDSVLTKNEFMRDKGFFARLIGSFMSEPTATASMLVDAVDKYNRAIQGGMTKQRAWQRNGKQIARTIYVYSVGAVMLAAVQAAADALRDDDDYQTFMEKWLEAFGGNAVDELMPLNKLPIISDFYEAAKEIVATWTGWDIYGNPPQSVFMQWYDSLVKGGEILHDRINGEDTNYTWYGGIYKLLQALSGMTGLPMAAATREAITAWNNTVGAMAPSLKVKTYEPSEKAQIKYAYEDGYLTAEEATQELLEKALVDTEDEAYWTIQGWEAGEGYSRYDAIMDAVRNGTGFGDAMDELTSHGYTEREVLSQVKSGIGEMYRDGQITKQQATRMMEKHLDMTDDEITEVVNKWSCQVVTGIPYDDIRQEFLDGNITASRAIDMRVRYGGYTREEATETVTEWRAEKETGIAYDEIDEAFHAGEISQADARDMYVTYGGKTAEEAEEKVAVLAFVKEHPECKGISYAAVEDYTTYCEADGVPAGTFYDAWKYNSNTHADVDANGESISGSKKIKVLVYIDSLALTSAQKDSLYYAFGWAQSKIYEAPWH